MKKNLIFLTLLISVLMVSVVSASITGYLVTRGAGIATDGATATLKGVGGGVATIAVTTPTGVETVQVQEGETATVGDVQISASDLKQGTLFARGRANVKINVVPASREGVGASVGGAVGAVATGHTHLSDLYYIHKELSIQDADPNHYITTGEIEENPTVMSSDGTILGSMKGYASEGQFYRNLYLQPHCNSNDIVIQNGFSIKSSADYKYEHEILLSTVVGSTYSLNILFKPPYSHLPKEMDIWITCARIEPTLHQFSQDY